jgi:hypothetical protein
VGEGEVDGAGAGAGRIAAQVDEIERLARQHRVWGACAKFEGVSANQTRDTPQWSFLTS